ncbi:hypothetical protein FI667_g16466, partial [Globisporangium splendens]
MNGDLVRFWLEDRQSKQQWESDELDQKELALFNNIIVAGSTEEYLSMFKQCLKEASSDAPKECECTLVAGRDNSFILLFTLRLTVYNTTWHPKYRFILKPIPIEPIKIVEAKLRDSEEEVARLRYMLQDANGRLSHAKPFFLECDASTTTTTTTEKNAHLHWKSICESSPGSKDTFEVASDGKICIERPGAYWVNLTVFHEPQPTNDVLFALQQSSEKSMHRSNCKDFPVPNYGACSNQLCLLSVVRGQELGVVSLKETKILQGSILMVVPLE